jgi:hypothetical protein
VGINITRYKKKINTQIDNRSKLNNRPTLDSTLVQPYWKNLLIKWHLKKTNSYLYRLIQVLRTVGMKNIGKK